MRYNFESRFPFDNGDIALPRAINGIFVDIYHQR